ncbi:MAG: response regulator transcription factor [Clostridia bacterium]|nr:response regulator transcription factor [Clostridia bacterium]
MFRILIVEDDPGTSRLMQAVLKHAGYKTLTADNGENALELMDVEHVDLILLDVMMPVMNGHEFTETLRAGGDTTPILMVTAKQLPQDKCKGFLAGTDDYMVKPVNEDEMLLRIKALLRRAKIASERQLQIGALTLNYDAQTVSWRGESQTLPLKEFQLLYKLLSCPDRIFTRWQLMDEIWGMETDSADATINVHISRIRKRFEDCPVFEIRAIRGIGYKAVILHE